MASVKFFVRVLQTPAGEELAFLGGADPGSFALRANTVAFAAVSWSEGDPASRDATKPALFHGSGLDLWVQANAVSKDRSKSFFPLQGSAEKDKSRSKDYFLRNPVRKFFQGNGKDGNALESGFFNGGKKTEANRRRKTFDIGKEMQRIICICVVGFRSGPCPRSMAFELCSIDKGQQTGNRSKVFLFLSDSKELHTAIDQAWLLQIWNEARKRSYQIGRAHV